MTLANTDLHPSHDWLVGSGEDPHLICSECLACSYIVGSGSTGNCIGSAGLEKELINEL